MYDPTFAHRVTMAIHEDRLQDAARRARQAPRPEDNRLQRLFAWRQIAGAPHRLVRRVRLATSTPQRG